MIENTESLREQVMIGQFEMATGCTREQSRQILQSSRWELETALSMFFQDGNVPAPTPGYHQHHRYPITGHFNTVCAPCNTPATPPSFPEALLALQKMQTNDWPSAGGQQQQNMGAAATAAMPPPSPLYQQNQTPKVLAPFNPMPPPCDKFSQQSCDWSSNGFNMTSSASTITPKCLPPFQFQQQQQSSENLHINHTNFANPFANNNSNNVVNGGSAMMVTPPLHSGMIVQSESTSENNTPPMAISPAQSNTLMFPIEALQ